MRTIKVILVDLHKSLRRSVKLGMIGRNPAFIAEPSKYQPKEMKIFTAVQVSQMFLAARGDHIEALYNLAVTMGMR